MDCVVCLHAEWCPSDWHHVLRHARDGVLREVFTMDNCRQTALLQQVQDSKCTYNLKLCKLPLLTFSAKNTHHCRTVELRQSHPPLHFTVELPQIWLFHPMAQFCDLSTNVLSPSIFTMAYQIAIFFVLEDTWHYWSHRALHTPRLYKMIHKIHHSS